MSDRVAGTAASAVGEHSRDAGGEQGSGERGEDLAGRARGIADRVATAASDAGESVSRSAGEAGETAARLGQDAAESASGMVRQASESATRLARQAYDRGAQASAAAEAAVRENPLPALLTAGVIGLAIGYLIARR